MECPSCGRNLEGSANFCPSCGKKLPAIIKDYIRQEIQSTLEETTKPDLNNNLSTPTRERDIESRIKETEYATEEISYATDDIRKIEYKRILTEIFADRQVTADEIILLAKKIKELDLDETEALNIQNDVARELGFDIYEQGDLFLNIILEVNTNKSYFADEIDNLEFRITNASNEQFEKMTIWSFLINQKIREDRQIGTLKAEQKIMKNLPFAHNRSGNESVEVCLTFFDSSDNPSVYKSEFQVRVLTREQAKAGTKSINISVTADLIFKSDLSNVGAILENEEKPISEKRSSYEESEKIWKRLPLMFDEDETNRRRNELIINKKVKEGEEKFSKGTKIKIDAEKMAIPVALDTFKAAFALLSEAKECFKKVREINPEHAFSYDRVREIRQLISEIENKIGILEKEPEIPPIKLSSGVLLLYNVQKKIYIYSKNKIALGRDGKNDMPLRIIPYHWKTEHDKEVKKYIRDNLLDAIPIEYFQLPENKNNLLDNMKISSIHAEIINSEGKFYIRDVGTKNTGSANGTFLEGKKLLPLQNYPLRNNVRINIAKVLDLECQFLGKSKKVEQQTDRLSSCQTVFGDLTDSCFGIDKQNTIDAIKFRRRNNFADGEEYIILLREVTIGRSRSNGIVVDSENVSDIHARLFYRDNQYWLEDLNSKHGTWVNGEQAMPNVEVSLGRQSEIMIGDMKINFEGFK